MSELDFSELTDDQIIELAVGLAREAMRRNPATAAAFEQSLLDERSKVEAAARGSLQARRSAERKIEEQSARAEAERQREATRRRHQGALVEYLRRAATITQRHPSEMTLVWKKSDFGRGAGPRLQLNAGTTGEDASWHLVDYLEQPGRLHTSPGLQRWTVELLAWARETSAVIRALGIDRTTIIRGIEL